MAAISMDEIYEQVVKPLPAKERLRLLAKMAADLSAEPCTRPRRPHQEAVAELRAQQRARGHQPRTREEIDTDLRMERESWGE